LHWGAEVAELVGRERVGTVSPKWSLTPFLKKWIPPNFWWMFLLCVTLGVLRELRRIDGSLSDMPLIVAVAVPIMGGLAYLFTWIPWKLRRMKDAIEQKNLPELSEEAKSSRETQMDSSGGSEKR
jgi:CBS domain containing-hemolysin-like protein